MGLLIAGDDNEDRHSINTAKMVRYAATEIDSAKSARARGSYLRVSYKNTRETAQAVNGWKLDHALKFLENVKEHKEAVPMRRYAGSTGRTSRQGFRRLQGPLASQVRRLPPRSPQERRSQRRHQGPRYQQPRRQAHPGQSGTKAATTHIPCSRPYQPVHEQPMPH